MIRGVFNKQSFLTICTIFFLMASKAQSSTPVYTPNVIPPSPEAAMLMKFTDVPVSAYTGTADINVPIYNISARGISVPIGLSYHTGGIRLEEEATWVGLGWALNAGGMISRTIRDQDDFIGQKYFNTVVPDVTANLVTSQSQPTGAPNYSSIGPWGYDFYCSYLTYTDQGTKDYSNVLPNNGAYDMEPDIYSYNLPGKSGKFMISRAGKVVLQKQDNISISFESNGNSFTVLDEKGNKFVFVDKIYTTPATGGAQSISSWMLSKIITQLNDTVQFTYQVDNTWSTVKGDVFEVDRFSCTSSDALVSSGAYVPALYLNVNLQKIDFANGELQFAFDANRNDLQNGKKLNAVSIYSKTAGGALSFVKEDTMYYSYFNQGQAYGTNQEYERLRLDSVKEMSGGLALPPYSFLYNQTFTPQQAPLSNKHSFSSDHWGYFNGNTSNSGFTPAFEGYINNPYLTNPQLWVNLAGANREPDTGCMKAFILQQVTYPTGGQSIFTYEANTYDITKTYQTGTPDFPMNNYLVDTFVSVSAVNHGTTSGTINMIGINQASPNATLSVTFRNPANYRNTTGKITFQIGSYSYDVNSSQLDCSQNSVCTLSLFPVQFMAQSYTWSAYIDPSVGSDFGGIYVTVAWQEPTISHYHTTTFTGGGLRIKTITEYTGGVAAKKRRYDYTYTADNYGWGPTSFSYGRLMSFPSYLRYEPIQLSETLPNGNLVSLCLAVTRSSGSNTSISSCIQSNIIGYDQVAEYIVDPATNLDIGKTVYTYYNVSDSLISYHGFRLPGVFNIGNTMNGLLLTQTEYVNTGGIYSKVKEVDNFYHTANRTAYLTLKPQNLYTNGFTTGCPPGSPGAGTEVIGNFYPSIKSEKVLLDNTIEYDYQQGDPTKYVTLNKTFKYDNPVHYLVTRSIIYDSKGNNITTRLKYPQDYGNPTTGNTVLDTMIERNMVIETIEKQDSLYYSGSNTGYVTGAQLNLYKILTANANTVVQDKIYKLDVQSPVTNFQPFSFTGNTLSLDSRNRLMASFDQYDTKNNIQQYTGTDQNPVTIIWDYNNIYPIAQAKNAAIADVAATSFEADGKGGWAFAGTPIADATSPTGSMCYGLSSGSVSKSGLTSGTTYVVSYWSKTGASYTVTGSASVKQGKTINGWTYFEHTATGATTITVSGSGSIDELRLYPTTAQMTTYCYSPLLGMTTACDADNRATYYFYDGIGRLKWIKDQDGNIIKTFQYHYTGQAIQY